MDIPYNHKSINIAYKKNFFSTTTYNSQHYLTNVAFEPLTVTGDGEFYGNDATKFYNRLLALFSSKQSALLFIPNYKPFYALLSSITIINSSSDNFIKYKFSFIESSNNMMGGNI